MDIVENIMHERQEGHLKNLSKISYNIPIIVIEVTVFPPTDHVLSPSDPSISAPFKSGLDSFNWESTKVVDKYLDTHHNQCYLRI
jgi:hypothetical protein